MKKTFYILLIICVCLPFFAQTQDALAIYRSGRDMESRGLTVDAQTSYSNAVDICMLELSYNSSNMESYVVLCWCLFRLKRYDETITYSLEALKLNANEYRIIENLGETYFYLKNYTESMRNLEKYVAALPNGDRTATAYFFLGEIYRITDKPNHADIAYSLAVRKESGIALWWYRLGNAREKAGYKESAKIAFQRALSINPNYQDAKQALSRLS